MKRNIHIIVSLLIAIALYACGGGGNSQTAGIGGTGITSGGTITGFGSIFVNGVEFDTSSAGVTLDGVSALESDLKLGMFVTVVGTLDQNGTTGTATNVVYNNELEGPVSTTPVADPDNLSKTFEVMGRTVIVHTDSTVFDTDLTGTNFTFTNISQNDIVEISGHLDQNQVLHATRVEKKGTVGSGSTQVKIKGTVSNLGSNQFDLTNPGTTTLTVNVNGSTDLGDVTNGVLANGMRVKVQGTLDSVTSITASEIDTIQSSFSDDLEKASIEGIITDYVDDSSFKVGGLAVDASSASFSPSALSGTLADGVHVEVEGPIINGTLQASEVEGRGGEIRIFTTVASTDPANNTITMLFGNNGTVTVTVNSKTKMKDDTSDNNLTINNIAAADFLQIEAIQGNSSEVIATSIIRKTFESDIETKLHGPVQSFNSSPGSESVTIFGVTYTTNGSTDFELIGDVPTDSATFFSQVSAGTTVSIKDKFSGGVLDGVANEMEIEN